VQSVKSVVEYCNWNSGFVCCAAQKLSRPAQILIVRRSEYVLPGTMLLSGRRLEIDCDKYEVRLW